MSLLSIPHIRLINQQLVGTQYRTPKEIVSWLGAVQSQDYNMAKWAVGMRLPGSTDKQIEDALNSGEIIRTHILRPTWHFVVKEDIHWMLLLTGPRIKQALHSYNKITGLEVSVVKKAIPIITTALSGKNYLTRLEIGEVLKSNKISVTTHLVSHIMFHLEMDALVCSGVVKGKKQTYCLLDEVMPRPKIFDKDKALEELARRFFTSHAPATLQDFTWWSGLMATDARKALEMIRSDFVCEEIEGQTYWLSNTSRGLTVDGNVAHLLPAFDEYVVSYKNRKDIFSHGSYSKVITSNGLFRPTVMVNGQVVGMWKKAVKNKTITAEVELFIKLSKDAKSAVAEEIAKYQKYIMCRF